ncbi:2980_t:CDS:2, partial [Acaulospora morrowiae]
MINQCFSLFSKLSRTKARKTLGFESKDEMCGMQFIYGDLETPSDYDYDSSETSSIDSYEEELSGNPEMDEFLLSTKFTGNTLYWIPYDEFDDIREIGKGGISTVFVANWRGHYDRQTNDTMKVALKQLHNSENVSKRFLDELRALHSCAK